MTKIKNLNLVTIYIVIISFISLALGLSDAVFSNFFKDAYDVTASQRGFIEIPREIPGIISVFIIASLSRLGDIKITIISQILAFIGITLLGLTTPEFYVMTGVLFIFSVGVHVYMPLCDSIAMSIVPSENMGTALGKFKGISTFFSLIAAVIVFIGFKFEFFTFKSDFKLIFIISGILFLCATALLYVLSQKAKLQNRVAEKPKLIFKKKYIYYYILAIMNGVQKQIVLVYAPWVIIEILGKGADTMSLLLIASSLCGIFFIPYVGRCIDKFGIKNMLYADAISFIVVYLAFAFITYNLHTGNYSTTGIAVFFTFLVFVIDRMSSQMGIIRTIYLKNIIDDNSELLPTISLGITLDHIVAIICSYLSGLIWMIYGPHIIFILAASFSLVNLTVAKLVKIK